MYSFSGYTVDQATAKAWVTSTVSAIKGVNGAAQVSVSQIQINDQYHPVGTSNVDYKGTLAIHIILRLYNY